VNHFRLRNDGYMPFVLLSKKVQDSLYTQRQDTEG
jgi:hypothetical protein